MKRSYPLAFRAIALGALVSSGMMPEADAGIILPLSATGSGPITINLVTPTTLKVDEQISFASFEPFPLTTGFFEDFIDLTIPAFPEKEFASEFSLAGPNGNALFGTFTVDTDVFPDPLHELNTGTFTITSGAGSYANATGQGTYTTTNVFNDTNQLDGGSTTAEVEGSIRLIPEPATLVVLSVGLLGICLVRARIPPNGEPVTKRGKRP